MPYILKGNGHTNYVVSRGSVDHQALSDAIAPRDGHPLYVEESCHASSKSSTLRCVVILVATYHTPGMTLHQEWPASPHGGGEKRAHGSSTALHACQALGPDRF